MNSTAKADESASFNAICVNVASDWRMNMATYISFLFAFPLHVYIIFGRYLRVAKKRIYHLLIILQSVNEIVKVSFTIIHTLVSFILLII